MKSSQARRINVELLRKHRLFPDWADAVLITPVLFDPYCSSSVESFLIRPVKRSRFGDYFYAKKTWRHRSVYADDSETEDVFDELYRNIDNDVIVTRDGIVVPARVKVTEKYIVVKPR